MKFMPWINNGGGGNMGPTNYAYCNDYFPLLPFADSLLNMGSYGAVGYSFGPGNARSIAPVLCTNRSAGVVEPSTAPGGRWCGLGGTVKDILTHGGRKSQLSPGVWMSGCCSGSGSSSQLCRSLGPVSTTTTRGWTQKRLKDFLAYVGTQGATTITIWSGLEASKRPWNATFPAAVDTCPWFVPTLLEWVARIKTDDDDETTGVTLKLPVPMDDPPQNPGYDNGVGQVPIRGYQSWNDLGSSVSEALLRDRADALVSTGLAALGYNYVCIDDIWARRAHILRRRFKNRVPRPSFTAALALPCHHFRSHSHLSRVSRRGF